MAKQSGIIKLEGTIGGVSFYKSKDGYLAREKGGVDASRIKSDPAFQRTRENGSEFGRAGAAGKLLRTAFRALLMNASDSRLVSRLTREMLKVIQEDGINARGLRNVIDGETELLRFFEFNIQGKLSTTLFAPFTSAIDRVAGTVVVTIPAFVPINMINAPAGATHFRIVAAGAAVDFENGTYEMEDSNSAVLELNSTATAALTLSSALTANSTSPIFAVLGVEFFQAVNGNMYPLKNGAYNALQLVDVDGN